MVFSHTCKYELAPALVFDKKTLGRFKRLFGLVPRWRRGSCSVTALKTWTRPNSRCRLVLARLATLASPAPALSARRTADLPMRLLLAITDVNIQGHREHRDIKKIATKKKWILFNYSSHNHRTQAEQQKTWFNILIPNAVPVVGLLLVSTLNRSSQNQPDACLF